MDRFTGKRPLNERKEPIGLQDVVFENVVFGRGLGQKKVTERLIHR